MGACKKTCQCGGHNLGVKSTAEFGVARQIGFMPYKNSSGAINYLDLSVAWDQTFWEGLIAAPLFADRLQVIDIDEYNPATSDPNTVTRPSGVIKKTRDGVTTYELWFDGGDGTLYDNLKSLECGDWGFILGDDCGRVAGKECEADKLRVTQIAKGSIAVIYNPATDADEARIRMTFNIDNSESPVFDIVSASDIEYAMSNLESISDTEVIGTPTATTTQAVIVLEAANSISKNTIPAEGLDTSANWTITDSAGATSVPTLVTEAPAGTYTLDYAAIATGSANFHYIDVNFEVDVDIVVS